MATFLRPMTRAKAESVLSGVIARAVAYNDDADKLHWIDELVVFGSYLDPENNQIGDLDLTCRVSIVNNENISALTDRWKVAYRRQPLLIDATAVPRGSGA
jgi:hypothetical protein